MPEDYESAGEAQVNTASVIPQNVVENWNTLNYLLECIGDNPSVIVLGEEHTSHSMHQKQLQLIDQLKPEYVLHEIAAGQIYDPGTKKYIRQKGRKFDDTDDAIGEPVLPAGFTELADTNGFRIVGCDITMAEITDAERQIAEMNPEEYKYGEFGEGVGCLIKRGDSNWMLMYTDDLLAPFRDERMAKTIIEYIAKTQKPLVVILGNDHAANIMERGLIKGKGCGYFYVDQTKTLTV